MSLVPTYVRRTDGKWLKNPTVGVQGSWFICWDDDDPPELVIAEDAEITDPHALIRQYKLPFRLKGKSHGPGCQRDLYHDGRKGTMKPARAYWLRQYADLPANAPMFKECMAKDKRDVGDCVFYAFVREL